MIWRQQNVGRDFHDANAPLFAAPAQRHGGVVDRSNAPAIAIRIADAQDAAIEPARWIHNPNNWAKRRAHNGCQIAPKLNRDVGLRRASVCDDHRRRRRRGEIKRA